MEGMDRILGDNLRNVGNVTMDNSNVYLERNYYEQSYNSNHNNDNRMGYRNVSIGIPIKHP